jgi:hypothetical protein
VSEPDQDSDSELAEVEACCRLKSEAARWVVERMRRLGAGADARDEVGSRDVDLKERARQAGCHLWMNSAEFVLPGEESVMEELARCYEATAEGIRLVRAMFGGTRVERKVVEESLHLLSKAQSALRVAVGRVWDEEDAEQKRAYLGLRGITKREQIYVRRYMTLEDPADPAEVGRLLERMREFGGEFDRVHGREKRTDRAIKRVKYHAKLIQDGGDPCEQWSKIAGTLEELIAEGVPPSHVGIREAVLPILGTLPEMEVVPEPLRRVLVAVDHYLASRPEEVDEPEPEPPTPEVARVARLLRGRKLVLIGGHRKPGACEDLEEAFGLDEVIWVETREHESTAPFEVDVAREGVGLVLLLIRWASHSFEDVKVFCDKHDRPMARLPGGYAPNQVAYQALRQCSGQLERLAGGTDGAGGAD